MTSYFDEHNCDPLRENETPNNQLFLARLLLDSGIANALGMTYDMFSERLNNLPPSTSKKWLRDEFPKYCFNESEREDYECPICLNKFQKANHENHTNDSKTAVKLPECAHTFHVSCLMRWLEHTSNCPLCRHDLPTDDDFYEEFKRQKKREKVREQELAALHDSMFS
jgi:hypothetical protein